LKEQLKRAAMAHLKNGEAQDLLLGEVIEKEVGEIEETYYEVVGNHKVVHAEEDVTSHTAQALASLETAEMAQILGNKSKKIRAWFGRTCTHTEQILVAPCGVIIVRETFYFAEAIPSVVVSKWHS
jgi:phage-related protein